jgi:hypothetical protein
MQFLEELVNDLGNGLAMRKQLKAVPEALTWKPRFRTESRYAASLAGNGMANLTELMRAHTAIRHLPGAAGRIPPTVVRSHHNPTPSPAHTKHSQALTLWQTGCNQGQCGKEKRR